MHGSYVRGSWVVLGLGSHTTILAGKGEILHVMKTYLKPQLLALGVAVSAFALLPSCTTVEAPTPVVVTTTTTETTRTVHTPAYVTPTVVTRTVRTY